ncbi:PIN domain-containing protein [Brachybacterium paraconglomeratum]|uniref:PIN domain-containing protein n=1 Tax=Brachybacterium paraconglomeratum TaxID=173362 RepID=UPI003519C962
MILDTNALYGRKPFTQANSLLLLALCKAGQVRLVVPEVVLLELSRQWVEEVQDKSDAVRTGVKKLNDALVEAGRIVVDLPEPHRSVYYGYVEKLFHANRAEVPPPPEVSVRDLLTKEIEVRKPFARSGKGFRDALIWETVREVCDDLEEPGTPVVFVTNNHEDFCNKKGGSLHPDLRQDLAEDQRFDIVPSLHHLMEHQAVDPLVKKFRVLEETFTLERLEELVDRAISDLHGVDIEEALGIYIGEGMYEVPISTGLDSAAFEEVMYEQTTITSEIYHAGDELTIRVTVEADCSFEGFVDKVEYFSRGEEFSYSLLEDWNDYVFRTSVQRRLRFTFSAPFTEGTRDDVVLSLDEAEEL